eukprot:4592917-Ditylum_brightwellii.AAC.1
MVNQLIISAIAMHTDFNARRKELKGPTIKFKLRDEADNNDSGKHKKKLFAFTGSMGRTPACAGANLRQH